MEHHPSAAPSRRRPHPAGPAVAVILAIVSIALAACGEPPRKARGKLDDPQHHTLRGHDFIEKGQWDKAGRSFDLAISLGRDYGPAYAGKAIVVAHGATGAEVTEDQREDLYDKADDLVDDALDKARNPTEKRAAHVAGIRVYRLTKAKSDWVEEAEEHYEDAVELDTRGLDPDPHFFMARAYRDAFRMRKAEDLYRKVLAMNSARNREADEELALVQKVVRAAPGTRLGRVIAFSDRLSRADLAGLLIEELRVERLFRRGQGRRFDTRFRAPRTGGGGDISRTVKIQQVTDIEEHPLRADILEVVKLRVSGLQPDANRKFYPDRPVLRAQFAMMVEDILIKVTGEKGLATRFIGQPSPFADVRNDFYAFNAIQTVTSRSLMEPLDRVNGVFGPSKPLRGVDALLVLRLLKDELRRYVR